MYIYQQPINHSNSFPTCLLKLIIRLSPRISNNDMSVVMLVSRLGGWDVNSLVLPREMGCAIRIIFVSRVSIKNYSTLFIEMKRRGKL